jgi:hypothetical protein
MRSRARDTAEVALWRNCQWLETESDTGRELRHKIAKLTSGISVDRVEELGMLLRLVWEYRGLQEHGRVKLEWGSRLTGM